MKQLLRLIALAGILGLVTLPAPAQPTRTLQQWMDLADRETDPQKAIGYYTEVLKLQPDHLTAAEAFNGLAVVRSLPAVRAYREAMDDVNQALRRNDKPAKYYAQRAYIFIQLSEYDRAALDYQQAIARAPDKADYYSGLSYCQTKHGRFDEAEATAQKGIGLDAQSPYAYRNRGRARLRKGQTDLAIADFQTSLNLKHGQPFRVYCDLGEAYEQKGDAQQALRFYQQALDLDSDYADALVGKRQLEQRLKIGGTAPLPASNFTGRRVALVLGNSSYRYVTSLDGQPANDAKAMEKRLRDLGFETLLSVDQTYEESGKILRQFYEKAAKADVALVFYAGHGIQYRGENYLMPVDCRLKTEEEISLQAYSVTNLIDALQRQEPRYCIIIIDACRDDPFSQPAGTPATGGKPTADKVQHRSVQLPAADWQPRPAVPGVARGFRPIHVENRIKNCYVALATAPGATARNGPQQHGYYTAALLAHLKKGRRIDDVFRDVRNEVIEQTRKIGFSQQPEYLDRTVESLIL
ncbi:hypothetical protein GCM10023187_32190 [Nibrella viscosa]|uniref:Caspase family p20 domain-containing protein n=1 Tax=Nibrella viscosa TaxID=1084524 RepID=A0ABP8KKY9_9BACT